jgi:hypothetical protein
MLAMVGKTTFTHIATGQLAHQPEADFSVGFSTSVALRLLLNLGSFWLLPPWDFPDRLRVTLWITTAIHVDKPTRDLIHFLFSPETAETA